MSALYIRRWITILCSFSHGNFFSLELAIFLINWCIISTYLYDIIYKFSEMARCSFKKYLCGDIVMSAMLLVITISIAKKRQGLPRTSIDVNTDVKHDICIVVTDIFLHSSIPILHTKAFTYTIRKHEMNDWSIDYLNYIFIQNQFPALIEKRICCQHNVVNHSVW